MSHPLDVIFRPESVAVVGASTDPRKRGHQALQALRRSGFGGRVLPVNPKGGTILDLPVHPSVEEISEVPDLALVCTPASTVPGVLEACGRKGIRGAVILAVGFGESGEEGRRLEARLRDVARSRDIRIVGPNTSGILNTHHRLNLIGVSGVPAGDVALLVQSGNVALSLMNAMSEREGGRGISICASVGNEAGIGFHEYLGYLAEDDRTRAVVVYAEGFRDGRAFLSTAARLTPRKPVVLLKGGRSRVGRSAARSHTGAVSGAYALLRAGLRQAGVEEVRREDELLPVVETLAGQSPSESERGVAILSDGGGQGTLAADALAEAGVELADLGSGVRDGLRELLGRAAAVSNPVDLAGRADAEPGVFARALEILARDPAVGNVLVVGLFGGYHIRFASGLEGEEVEAARTMARVAEEAGRGLVVHSMYASRSPAPLEILRSEGVPVLGSLDVASRCVEALDRRRPRGSRWDSSGWEGSEIGSPGVDGAGAGIPVNELLAPARRRPGGALTEPEGRDLLEAFGVPVARGVFCRTEEEARTAASELGGSLVAKVVSPAISHKTEVGGVEIGLRGPEEAARAFRTVLDRGRRFLRERDAGAPHPSSPGPDGVLLCECLPEPAAELLLGVRRDESLGPVATVGLGGVVVEVLGDVAHRVLPVERDDVRAMLDELRAAELLRGVRGRPAVDRDAVVDMLLALSAALRAAPELVELEMNPVFAYPDKAVAVDVRAFVEGDELRDAGRGFG